MNSNRSIPQLYTPNVTTSLQVLPRHLLFLKPIYKIIAKPGIHGLANPSQTSTHV